MTIVKCVRYHGIAIRKGGLSPNPKQWCFSRQPQKKPEIVEVGEMGVRASFPILFSQSNSICYLPNFEKQPSDFHPLLLPVPVVFWWIQPIIAVQNGSHFADD